MEHSNRNQLRAGVILSYVNLALSSLIPFFYTPVMLRILGQAEYGLYSLANSAVSYLSLLSLGFGSTIIRYISKYRAENKKDLLERTFGFFILLYSCLAILVIICGWCIAGNVEPIFHRGLVDSEIEKMGLLVKIMTINSALSFPVSVFSSVIIAYERYIFRKMADIILSIAAPAANLIALYMGYSSIGMSIAATLIQCMLLPAYAFYCLRRIYVIPKFKPISKHLIKEMAGVSFFHFLGAIVDMLFWATDKIILGMLASSVAVAIYNVGATFNNMIVNLSSSISGVLTPKITGMVVTNEKKEYWTELFVRVGRIQYVIVALVLSGYTVFGRVFINLWTGDQYADAYWVALLTMYPLCVPLIQNTGLSIVVAQNKHQFRSIVYLIVAIANVISTYLAVPHFGMLGAALCSAIAYIVGHGIVMNIYYYKVTGIDIPFFWINIGKMSIIPGIMLVIGTIVLNYVSLDSWFAFLIGVIIYTCIYGLGMYFGVLNEYEKDIIRKPVKKCLTILDKHK